MRVTVEIHTPRWLVSVSRTQRIIATAVLAFALALVPLVVLANDVFGDVPGTMPQHDAINRVYAAGIMRACTGGTPPNFCPNDPVLRVQQASQWDRALGLNGTVAQGTYVQRTQRLDGNMSFSSGFGTNPTGIGAFLVSPARVTVAAGQAIYVSSDKALGSLATGGATGLDLYICSQLVTSPASPLVPVGDHLLGLTVPQGQRLVFGLTAVIKGLGAGTYDVGLCGNTDTAAQAAAWNNNEWGYTSAFAVNISAPGASTAALDPLEGPGSR